MHFIMYDVVLPFFVSFTVYRSLYFSREKNELHDRKLRGMKMSALSFLSQQAAGD